jgi:hypothetical protein
VIVVPTALMAGGAGSAQASCAGPPVLSAQLEAATVAFVGTVVATTDGGRQARVRVESIWKGPSLPLYVDVYGSPASGTNAATSVDRTYQVGQKYLFVPVDDQRPFQDNDCTATQPYTTSVAGYAPADPRTPDPRAASDPELPGGSLLPLAILGAILIVGLLAAAVIVLRRWRRI